MTVNVQVLGAYVALRDGAPISDMAYGGRLPRRLARFLATRVDHAATQATIADALWGADQPADPAANVAVLVNRLRGALGDTAVVTMDGGYRFGGHVIVDADRFTAYIAEGHAAAGSGTPPRCVCGLSRGPGVVARGTWGGCRRVVGRRS